MENNWKDRFYMLLSVVVLLAAFVLAASSFDNRTCYKIPGCVAVRGILS
jgi:hypothetical protein